MRDIVICSFYTDDDYYRAEADALRAQLDDLGVEYVLEEVHKEQGQDWADICRRKVPFLHSVCEKHPDKRVFWIDVDCRLLALPDFVADSSADIVGFQRGFSSPLQIGYGQRTRFWEPCFWGVGTSPQARAMIMDAASAEAVAEVKATDDYFFENAWRKHADTLTFQIIPSVCVVGRGNPAAKRDAFFVFGSSGNVAEFKDKVVQHQSTTRPRLRHRMVHRGKKVLARLPAPMARDIVALSDRLGVTGRLVADPAPGESKQRRGTLNRVLRAGMDGDLDSLARAVHQLSEIGPPTPNEAATVDAARSFAAYSARPSNDTVSVSWWARPFPGNYGDWLSPLIIGAYTDAKITYQSPTRQSQGPHIMAVGSIGRFIKPSSIVVGTGISSDDVELNASATYLSVRGPITAQLVRDCGGPVVDSFGDPAVVLSRILPADRSVTNGRTAFVRHFRHSKLPVLLPEGFDEFSAYMSDPAAITAFVAELNRYDRVVTSAMHVYITCQSYGIPVSLVTFAGFESMVHGTGIKYSDYSLGAGLDPVSPHVVPLDLREYSFASIERDDRVSEAKKNEVEEALRAAVTMLVAPR